MKESRAWAYLKVNLPPWVNMERLEPMYPPGLPDTFWSLLHVGEGKRPTTFIYGPALCGWLELKSCEPDDPQYLAGRVPKLRQEQPLFLRRQAANGVPAGILLRVGDVEWLFWKAKQDHEWCRLISNNGAIPWALNVTDTASRNTTGPNKLDFERMFRELVTPWRLERK